MAKNYKLLKNNDYLIDSLKNNGIIHSPLVESIMRKVDRGDYSKIMEDAYVDSPHSIGYGATISAPHMHGMCLELLESFVIKPEAKILDVGSGSGYLTACFGRMVGKGGKVIGIDIIPELIEWSKENMKKHDSDLLDNGIVELKVGDGWKGDPSNAEYDAIHVGAAASTVPKSLLEQLKKGGRMVIPVGTASQYLIQIDKDENGNFHQKTITGVRYVPLTKTDL